jgi:regulator of replication initiation timing
MEEILTMPAEQPLTVIMGELFNKTEADNLKLEGTDYTQGVNQQDIQRYKDEISQVKIENVHMRDENALLKRRQGNHPEALPGNVLQYQLQIQSLTAEIDEWKQRHKCLEEENERLKNEVKTKDELGVPEIENAPGHGPAQRKQCDEDNE